jgi:hypothetical protein
MTEEKVEASVSVENVQSGTTEGGENRRNLGALAWTS